jgi:hypothetical protein
MRHVIGACAALALALPAWAIDVPLTYVKPPPVESPELYVSAIRAARADLLKDAAAAPATYDVPTSAAKLITLARDADTSLTEQAGRQARGGQNQRMSFSIGDEAFRSAKGDLWVAIDYLDVKTTAGKIAARLRVKGPTHDTYLSADALDLTGTGEWKQHVFHFEDAQLADEKPDEGDLYLYAWAQSDFQPSGYAFPQTQTQPPSGEYKLPELKAKQAAYVTLPLGGKDRLAVLDKASADDKFFSRLYFDANGNADLTDDPPIDGKVELSPDRANADFGTIDLTLEQEGKPYKYALKATCYYYGSPPSEFSADMMRNMLRLQLRPVAHYAGSFEQDGKTYRVALGDANCDGTFTDKLAPAEGTMSDGSLYFRGDSFNISSEEMMKDAKTFLLGDQLLVGKQLYDVAIDIPGAKLTLTPAEGARGTLRLPQPVKRIELISDRQKAVMCVDSGDSLELPEATYAPYEYSLEREAAGGKWSLTCKATQATTGTRVTAGAQATLAMGEPFRTGIDVPAWERQNMRMMSTQAPEKKGGILSWFTGSRSDSTPQQPKRSVRLEMRLTGAGNESVTNLQLVDGKSSIEMSPTNRNQPKEPTYRIMKPDGELLAQGSFEYG